MRASGIKYQTSFYGVEDNPVINLEPVFVESDKAKRSIYYIVHHM
jgi:hypothetical protein